MSSAKFNVCSIGFVRYLLNCVPFLIFVLIHDYCTPLSLDRFPNTTILQSLSFKIIFQVKKNLN